MADSNYIFNGRPKLSVGTICLDEIEIIDYYFKYYEPLADEIIICDGVSVDGTWERILEWQEKCTIPVVAFQRKMGDSFSTQRNFVAERVTGEWVLWIDVDEVFAGRAVSKTKLLDYLDVPEYVWAMKCLYYSVLDRKFTTIGHAKERLFAMRNREYLRWWRQVHEIPTCPPQNIKSDHSLVMLDYGRTKSKDGSAKRWGHMKKFMEESERCGIPIDEDFYMRDMSTEGTPLPKELLPDLSWIGWRE
jgi:glycosyltransferase involved in cell wall biosynthesis